MLQLSDCETRSEETWGSLISLWTDALPPRSVFVLQTVASVKCGDHIQRSSAAGRHCGFLLWLQSHAKHLQWCRNKDTVKLELMSYQLGLKS